MSRTPSGSPGSRSRSSCVPSGAGQAARPARPRSSRPRALGSARVPLAAHRDHGRSPHVERRPLDQARLGRADARRARGQARRRLREIDLIVAAAHYVLPDAPNVVRHGLPFMHVDEARLEAARSSWASRLADLPRPLTALMVGRPTGGLRFDLDTGRTLFERSLAIAEAQGSSLYVTTSRRTPAAVVD
ncbi:MAG: mitochondrial fission ELM1 family protein [Spirochaetaceae bacterium]|nr:mitochondrial fission ELM1 family protein [Spirochaetaceae bacterium]